MTAGAGSSMPGCSRRREPISGTLRAWRRPMPAKFRTLLALVSPSLALAASTPALAASGGPDSYGYSYVDNNSASGPTYSASVFTNATTLGTLLTTASNADDTSESVTLPFSFSFYGLSYSSL